MPQAVWEVLYLAATAAVCANNHVNKQVIITDSHIIVHKLKFAGNGVNFFVLMQQPFI